MYGRYSYPHSGGITPPSTFTSYCSCCYPLPTSIRLRHSLVMPKNDPHIPAVVFPESHPDCSCFNYQTYGQPYLTKMVDDTAYEYYTSYEMERNEPRRKRSYFDEQQLSRLERYYQSKKYVTYEERIHLSNTLRLDETQIKIWFQNRRAKEKRKRRNNRKQKMKDLENERIESIHLEEK